MKNLTITEQDIRDNGPIEIETQTDHLVELTFNEKTENFAVWLNGKIIDTKKTFNGILFSLELINCRHCLGL